MLNKREKTFFVGLILVTSYIFVKLVVAEFSLQPKIAAWMAGKWEHQQYSSAEQKINMQADLLKGTPYLHFRAFDLDGRLFSEGHALFEKVFWQNYFYPDGQRKKFGSAPRGALDRQRIAEIQKIIQQLSHQAALPEKIVLPQVDKILYLVAAPGLDPQITADLAHALQEAYAIEVMVISDPYVVPENLSAPQLNADLLLAQAGPYYRNILEQPSTFGLLIILEKDLRVENMNFIFATADIAHRIGVMSLARFEMDHPSPELLKTRAVKQAFSTVGFIAGIGRCPTRDCARAYPNSVAEHDRKSARICDICMRRLARIYQGQLR